MKIFDCFTFNDELEVLDIRLNTLNKFVDKFIIVESKTNHQGNEKKVNFNINLFQKFKDKINYFLIDKIPSNYSSWEMESYQRNYISNGLNSCEKNDVIIISDIDEIPNLEIFNFNKMKRKFYTFEQEHFMYKLNLERPVKWLGSKLCKYKNLKSPQWLRSLKTHKKYSVWRIDKIFDKNYSFDFEIIKNGGWHFGWLKSIDDIILKINSYAHIEHNNKLNNNKIYIKNCIKKKISFLNNNKKLKIRNIDLKFPNYIVNNKSLSKKWISK
jgi:beta-1,4-mannosyl-glycoprotein beta-1,4-N-acetylglucosaminyltransferase